MIGSRVPLSFQPSSRTLPMGLYIGLVKQNTDAQFMGRLGVYIPDLGGADPTDPGSWITVSYASPFAGSTDPTKISKTDTSMAGSQQSYGFWAVPPDINNEVVVFFANNDMSRGYWFACTYQQNMNWMVPGIAADKSGSPVVEYNKATVSGSTTPTRPPFTPLVDGLAVEGLKNDPERGVPSTSARRESPSKVFGLLSPRGNTVHIDDNESNEFIRFRTRSGAQILIHETSGYVYINSKNGSAWLEVSDVGIDIYSLNSVSVRAQGNVNVRADKNIVLDAGQNIFMRAGQDITLVAGKDIQVSAAAKLIMSSTSDASIGTPATLKLNGATIGLQSSGNTTMQAATHIRSGKILDNTETPPDQTAATAGGPLGKETLDTTSTVTATGTTWKATSGKVDTILDRMPTHEPWSGHPRSNVPPPPTENIIIDGAPTYGAGSSSNVNPDGTLNDAGCSLGVANTKPISNDVYNSIMAASAKTGTDPATMLAFADIESSFKPGAGASTSSASGLYQFTGGTWNSMVSKYGAKYNVDPGQKNDASANALMGGQFIADNSAALQAKGIANPTPGQLYVTHFMGSGGGPQLISAAQNNPNADAASLFPAAAAANPSIFAGKTVGQVYSHLTTMADSKAAAYAGQYGLDAPCSRSTGEANAPGSGDGTNLAGRSVGSGQCVALVQKANGLPHTSQWSPGQAITADNVGTIPPGTAVATFNSQGVYANATDGTSHAAILLGASADGSGMRVMEQYVGKNGQPVPAHETIYPFAPGRQVINNAGNYSVINVKGTKSV